MVKLVEKNKRKIKSIIKASTNQWHTIRIQIINVYKLVNKIGDVKIIS